LARLPLAAKRRPAPVERRLDEACPVSKPPELLWLRPQSPAWATATVGLNHDRTFVMDTKTGRIRALNDELRAHLPAGVAVMTPGVAALGQIAIDRIVKTIAVFDDFCHANDPYEEHGFGTFEADGQKIFFKIDYYDKTLTYHSPDPSDPSVTERVITIMLVEEY
jgi:hypothetical protein